jgi:hypothetical protein
MIYRKYPTEADIAEMKASGYERRTIEEAEHQWRRGEKAADLCAQIGSAFAGVTLGNGVGLSEALALDDYADEAICAACRARDEKNDWSKIPYEELHDSLAFFDSEGMRFHLPAYMVGELSVAAVHSPVWTLTNFDRLPMKGISLLSSVQRDAVRAFLEFVCDNPDHAADRARIRQSLETFWKKSGPL